MEKTIHVNAYTKSDGTEVREHYRNIQSHESFMPEEKDDPWKIEENPYKKEGTVMHADGGTVLTGSVIFDDIRLPQGSGDVLEAIATVAIGLGMTAANMAYQMYIKPALAETLQPQLNNAISNIKATQVQVEKLSNKYLDQLVNTKNQQEYQNLLKNYTQQKALSQKLNDSIAKIDYANSKSDYKTVAEELKNYQSNFDEVMKNTANNNPIMTQNQQNNILANTMLPSSPNILANTVNRLASTPIENKMAIDAVTKIAKPIIKDSEELWKAFSRNFSQSKQYIEKNGNLVYSVSQLPSQELQQIVTQKLQQQLGVSDALGVIFQPDSSLSKVISNSTEFKNFFIENKTQLLNGQIIEKSSTHFDWKTNPNLGTALGNADILYSYIDQNGNLCSIVFDTYDFNKNENILIDIARIIQETKLGRSYYTLSLITIPFIQWILWL